MKQVLPLLAIASFAAPIQAASTGNYATVLSELVISVSTSKPDSVLQLGEIHGKSQITLTKFDLTGYEDKIGQTLLYAYILGSPAPLPVEYLYAEGHNFSSTTTYNDYITDGGVGVDEDLKSIISRSLGKMAFIEMSLPEGYHAYWNSEATLVLGFVPEPGQVMIASLSLFGLFRRRR